MCTHTAQSSVLSNLIFNWHFIVLLIIIQFHDYTLHTQPAQRSTHFELVYYFFQFYSSKDFLWFSFLASKLCCTYCSLCCVVLNRKLCRSKTIFVCCLFLCSVFSHFVLSLSKNCKAVLHSLKGLCHSQSLHDKWHWMQALCGCQYPAKIIRSVFCHLSAFQYACVHPSFLCELMAWLSNFSWRPDHHTASH